MPFGNFHLRRADAAYREAVRPESGGRRSPLRKTEPATREESTTFRSKSQTDLSVVTAEGDRITISLAAQVTLANSTQTRAGASSQQASASSSSQLRIAVEGDLSEAELKDLGHLLKNLGEASRPGAEAESVEDPAGFAGLTSLASFRYRYQQRAEVGTLVRASG